MLPSTNSSLPCLKPRGSDNGKVDDTIDIQPASGFCIKSLLNFSNEDVNFREVFSKNMFIVHTGIDVYRYYLPPTLLSLA